MRTLVQLSFFLTLSTTQNISYDSMFCTNFLKMNTPEPLKLKYKTMVENLNNDKTLRSQKKRAMRFINNNWKEIWGVEYEHVANDSKALASIQLESRWRIVKFLKGLLAKMKPHLTAMEYEEISTLLWETDKNEKHNVQVYYFTWKLAAVRKISAHKKSLIFDVIDEREAREENAKFNDDQSHWAPAACHSGCF